MPEYCAHAHCLVLFLRTLPGTVPAYTAGYRAVRIHCLVVCLHTLPGATRVHCRVHWWNCDEKTAGALGLRWLVPWGCDAAQLPGRAASCLSGAKLYLGYVGYISAIPR